MSYSPNLLALEKSLSSISHPQAREFVRRAVQKASVGDYEDLKYAGNLRHWPVGVEEFMCSEKYLNKKSERWPEILNTIIELNTPENGYEEAVLTGGIGTAKTTIALDTQAYQLYLLSCFKNPHAQFGLDRSSEILFVFQSINETLAKAIDFDRFKSLIQNSDYFKQYFPFDKSILSELRFPNRIGVKPVSGADTAAIGQNVIGGVIDEVNFMAITENSKLNIDGGEYDQAQALYNSIARRRESRFLSKGKLPGMLCLVSSKRYPGQFTDRKEIEAQKQIEETGRTKIYVYDKRVWEVKPPELFTGEWFNVFIGTEFAKPRVLGDTEEVSEEERPYIMAIPVEYKSKFQSGMMDALRDIAGVATIARFPFIHNTESISKCIGTCKSILSRDEINFSTQKLAIYPELFENKEQPRFVALDLSISGDATGVVIGHVPGFRTIDRGDNQLEILPDIRIDAALRVVAPVNGEIEYHRIRSMILKLKELGLNIGWVTADSFQSVDTIQIMRQNRISADYLSVDTSIVPYQLLKMALYDGRVSCPDCDVLKRELASLEHDPKKMKVDHPPKGSKDVADALAACVYGLSTRRIIWARHGVSPNKIPTSIAELFNKQKELKDKEGAK